MTPSEERALREENARLRAELAAHEDAIRRVTLSWRKNGPPTITIRPKETA